MITFEEAVDIAMRGFGDKWSVNPQDAIEKPYGWVLFPQTKEYLETGDSMKQAIGFGGILVLKETGRRIQFGSIFGTEEHLFIYELGYFDHDNWDLVIAKVMDENQAVDIIFGLDLQYVMPEFAYGEEWRIPRRYTRKQLQQQIRNLPLRLNVGKIYFNYRKFEELKNQRYIEYFLEPGKET